MNNSTTPVSGKSAINNFCFPYRRTSILPLFYTGIINRPGQLIIDSKYYVTQFYKLKTPL